MTEPKSLAVRDVTLTTWQTIQAIAPTVYASRLFGVSSPEQACVIALKGVELGLPIAASYELITVIQGKPALIPRGALALILRSGELVGMKLTELQNPVGYRCWMRRKNGLEHEEAFTLADAQRAGLVKADSGWERYPRNMAKWRAIGFCADVLFPDICGGLRRADEFGAIVDSSGDVIDVQASTPEATPAAIPEPPAPEVLTLQALVDRYGADRVMEAAGERIPATDEDLAAVRAKLESGNAGA